MEHEKFKSEFLTGIAGTGKTYTLKQRIAESKKGEKGENRNKRERLYGMLAASTGIAAVNLGEGVTTIHSALRVFDEESLQDSFVSGRLFWRLKDIADEYENLIVDECSMLSDIFVDVLIDGLRYVNDLRDVQQKGGLGIVLTGDFCQLPPVKAKYGFEGKHWEEYFTDGHVTKLEKIWRQTDKEYIEALNCARRGDGERCAEILREIEDVTWRGEVDSHFEGTTLLPINKMVDRFNQVRLDELVREGKKLVRLKSKRWGKQRGEWKLIPEELELCDGAYVMVLSNETKGFTYANGDCGEVKEIQEETIRQIDNGNIPEVKLPAKVIVKLKRNGSEVGIRNILRRNMSKIHPDGKEIKPRKIEQYDGDSKAERIAYLMGKTAENRGREGEPYWDYLEDKWVVGEIEYMPLRLAYATSVHKSQGLSLDRLQVDFSNGFFSEPAMVYVALSRVKTPGGLILVGNERLIEQRCNVAEEVLRFV